MALLPADIPTGLVTGQFYFVSEDNIDADTDPTLTVVSGTVTFTSSAPVLRMPTKAATVIPLVFNAKFDANGRLVADTDPTDGLKLPATDSADISPLNYTWRVDFNLKNAATGYTIQVPSFSFSVPSGQTTDLTAVMPVDTSPGTITVQGPAGPAGDPATVTDASVATQVQSGAQTTAALNATYAGSKNVVQRAAPVIAGPLKATTLTIGRPVDVATDTTYNAFPSLAVTPTGRRVVTYMSGASHTAAGSVIKRRYSDDRGASWSADATVFTPAANMGYKALNLTQAKSGTLYGIGWRNDQNFTPPKGTIVQTSSTDNGVTFAAETVIAQPFTYLSAIECPIIVLPNGSWITAAYGDNTGLANPNYSVAVGKSTDLGATWAWTTVADGVAAVKAYTEPTIALLPNGTLHMLIRCTTTGDLTMYRLTSTDNGATWSSLVAAFGGEGRPNQVVTTDGSLACLYRTDIVVGGGLGAVCRVSRDNGVTWGPETTFTWGNGAFVYCHGVEVTPGVIAVAAGQEFNNGISDILYLHLSEKIAATPFMDMGVVSREARALSQLRSVIAYDTLERADEPLLRRTDSGHPWINYGNNGHQLVGGFIKTVNTGNTPTGCTSAFNTRAPDVAQIDTRFTFGGNAGMSLLFQMQDSINYYLFNLTGNSGSITPTLYKRVAGTLTSIVAGPVQNMDLTSWYPLRVTQHGSRIKIWVDNEKVIDVVDTTWTGKFDVGFQNTWDTQLWGPITVSR